MVVPVLASAGFGLYVANPDRTPRTSKFLSLQGFLWFAVGTH